MAWVMRAGKESVYLNKFVEGSRIYLPWEGYKVNLSKLDSREDFKQLVIKEKGDQNRTTISNWGGMLYSFSKEMEIGDCVLIPAKHSKSYILAKISEEYEFNSRDKDGLYHSRKIEIKKTDIPREIFSQQIIYSLGAFRTIFKVIYEDEVMDTIQKWSKEVGR
jgi:restriction system protein